MPELRGHDTQWDQTQIYSPAKPNKKSIANKFICNVDDKQNVHKVDPIQMSEQRGIFSQVHSYYNIGGCQN